MMWKRFPFIDIYERGKGAIVFTWNPQIYQWRLFRKKIIIQVSTPLKYCQWIVGGLVFDEGLVFLPTNFVIVILVQFCIFQKQKNPFFFSFTPPEFTASVTAENTLFYCSCWQKWMNLCLWHSVALSFSQFQVMPENFRSGGFSLQRFFFFFYFLKQPLCSSWLWLPASLWYTLIEQDQLRCPVSKVSKHLHSRVLQHHCVFSPSFSAVLTSARFLPGASFNMKTLTRPILYWISLETGDSHHKPNLEVFFYGYILTVLWNLFSIDSNRTNCLSANRATTCCNDLYNF